MDMHHQYDASKSKPAAQNPLKRGGDKYD